MPSHIRTNERSWQISMISDLNICLNSMDLQIVRIGGEATISSEERRLFPDAILYGDQNQTQILQAWELKLPDTPITDSAFIENAKEKAILLGLNSFFLWNFTSGVLYVKTGNDFTILKQWNETYNIQTRSDVDNHRNQWLSAMKRILIEINEYLLSGTISSSSLSSTLSDNIVASLINTNNAIVAEELKRKSVKNTQIGAFISEWWRNIKSEYKFEETDEYFAYAKVILLNWINRILFAHLIKPIFNTALIINDLNSDTSISSANKLFQNITNACDFYSVFNKVEYNEFLPKKTWNQLIELSTFLKENPAFLGNAGQIPQEFFHNILEKTVTTAKRVLNGQYSTPATLADILVRITVHNWLEDALDPCCGTGTIARSIQHCKKINTGNTQNAIKTTWASDKYSLPLQLSNIGLTSLDTIHSPNRIFQKNVFELKTNQSIKITNPDTGEKIELFFPPMGNIITNLPFVEFENISLEDKEFIKNICTQVKQDTDIDLDNRSDYYSYIVFTISKLLKENGRVGIITSNSWLGTKAGDTFFEALRHYYHVEQIHISGAQRWFENADVITVITILSKRPQISEPQSSEQTCFYTWKKNLQDLKTNEESRNIIINSALLNREIDHNIITRRCYSSSQIDSLKELNLSLNALFHDVDWLPLIYEKLTKISEILKVFRGERRGWDKLFYPHEKHHIEKCYIKKVLMNSRNILSLYALPDQDAFCCSQTIENLRKMGHRGALSWINKFKSGTNGTGRPLPEVLARSNQQWYEMSDSNTADFVTTMNPDKRLFYAKFEEPAFINQRLIGLKRKPGHDNLNLYHALLNSVIGMFYIEAIGFGRGLGALDINSNNLGSSFMLDPNQLTEDSKKAIIRAFKPLLKRNILSTEEELQSKDRENFDNIVLSAYGIQMYHDRIKQAIISMQRLRRNCRNNQN